MASRDSNVGIKQLYEAEEKSKEIIERARKGFLNILIIFISSTPSKDRLIKYFIVV